MCSGVEGNVPILIGNKCWELEWCLIGTGSRVLVEIFGEICTIAGWDNVPLKLPLGYAAPMGAEAEKALHRWSDWLTAVQWPLQRAI